MSPTIRHGIRVPTHTPLGGTVTGPIISPQPSILYDTATPLRTAQNSLLETLRTNLADPISRNRAEAYIDLGAIIERKKTPSVFINYAGGISKQTVIGNRKRDHHALFQITVACRSGEKGVLDTTTYYGQNLLARIADKIIAHLESVATSLTGILVLRLQSDGAAIYIPQSQLYIKPLLWEAHIHKHT